MSEINKEQLASALLELLGGVSQKESSPKVFHPQLGWVPSQKDTTGLPSSTPSAIWGHGPGGLFSAPALERPVFSAFLLPRLGLMNVMPVFPTVTINPLHGIFTGVTATTGDEPSGPCDDPPTAGMAKLCTHSFVFGLQSRQTRVFDIRRAGQLRDRGEHLDLQFLGNPWQSGAEVQTPSVPGGIGLNEVLNVERVKAAFELGVAWSRDFSKEIFTGNPTNNTAGGGRQYFYGLDILINTGYKDAITGQLCPAADSIVESFANVDINQASGSTTIVRRITSIYRRLRYIAENVGLMPVQWALAIKPTLFYELTSIWPWSYATFNGGSVMITSQNMTAFLDNAEMLKLRDDMRGDLEARTGQYLLIDGIKVPVVLDDGIAETVQAGASFRSAIYFVPLSVLGGTPSMYVEYLNFDAPNGAREFGQAFAPNFFQSSDGGRFLWHYKPPTNWCVQYEVSSEPRLILETPHLGARLTNIQYTPLAHTRDPYTDNSYYVDGGITTLNGWPSDTSYYAPN